MRTTPTTTTDRLLALVRPRDLADLTAAVAEANGAGGTTGGRPEGAVKI